MKKSVEVGVRDDAEVLLVEDNAADVRMLRQAFKETGMPGRLRLVRDGEEAMRYLLQQDAYRDSPRPSLVLLDLNLPRKSGRQVLAEMKRSPDLRSIPVLILSTSTSAADVQQAYHLHANCYIPKPPDFETLIELGHHIRSFWLRMVAVPGALRPQVSQKTV